MILTWNTHNFPTLNENQNSGHQRVLSWTLPKRMEPGSIGEAEETESETENVLTPHQTNIWGGKIMNKTTACSEIGKQFVPSGSWWHWSPTTFRKNESLHPRHVFFLWLGAHTKQCSFGMLCVRSLGQFGEHRSTKMVNVNGIWPTSSCQRAVVQREALQGPKLLQGRPGLFEPAELNCLAIPLVLLDNQQTFALG